MKSVLKVFIMLILYTCLVRAQEYIFFSDVFTGSYNDYSWGYANAPSTLELSGDKFKISYDKYYSGTNSLILHWKSVTGGDWAVAVAETGWPGHDMNAVDSLQIWVYAENEITSADLPKLFVEDLNNKKSDKIKWSDYWDDIPADSWTRVVIPVQAFRDNPGQADLTKIKTIFFGQNTADNVEHFLYLDEIKMFTTSSGGDTIPPTTPEIIFYRGYDSHIDIKWQSNNEDDLAGYYVYRKEGTIFNRVGNVPNHDFYFTDFVGQDITHTYVVSAYDEDNNESEKSTEFTASTSAMTDSQLLDMLQEANFRFFYDYAHPVSGLARERYGSGETCTIGGSGFGVMAIISGVERGFITREEGAAHILKVVSFLESADRFHGVWSHWVNGETGEAIPFSQKDDGGDLVETAFMIQGLLTARQYFSETNATETSIRNKITKLWEEVEWDWYRQSESSNFLYWHWSPNYNFQMNMRLQGPNETMIVYLLAIASPTHSIPASMYHDGWASSSNYVNGNNFYGINLPVGWNLGGPLFFAHYSFLGFDPRNKKDNYCNYFINNRNHTLINRAYCIDNPKNFTGYNETTWGLTASDDPFGYSAHEPNNDNGTITPTAALSSFPYTPAESMDAFKNFYFNYGETLWGSYGFKDAFNPTHNWTASSYIAIDQGPIMVMVENHRSALLWNLFMSNPEIQPMLDAIGFEEDATSTEEINTIPTEFRLNQNYPNPFNPDTIIEFSIPYTSSVSLNIYNALGEKVETLINKQMGAGNYRLNFQANQLPSGVYYCQIITEHFSDVMKMILLK